MENSDKQNWVLFERKHLDNITTKIITGLISESENDKQQALENALKLFLTKKSFAEYKKYFRWQSPRKLKNEPKPI